MFVLHETYKSVQGSDSVMVAVLLGITLVVSVVLLVYTILRK